MQQQGNSYYHVMIKPAGAACNAGCTYCFYLPKAGASGAPVRISDELLESFICQHIATQSCNEITFAWQGGEPTLLGIDFFRKAVRYEQKCAPAGKRILNTFQTNGLLLDDAWAEFFHAHRFLVGISIDGPEDLHDAYRRDRDGGPTFVRVMRAIELLKAHRVEFNTLTVVNRHNAQRPLDVYRFLRDTAGSRYLQFIPCAEPVGFEHAAPAGTAAATEWSVPPEDYGDFLIEIFDEWLLNDVGEVFVILFDVMLGLWLGLPSSACTFAPVCGNAVALEADGNLYSCDHYVYPQFKLGNLKESKLADLVFSEQQKAFGKAKADTLSSFCRRCEFLFACGGECPKNRFGTAPTGEAGVSYLCKGLKKFFRHIDPWMRLMAKELHAGRSADGVMRIAREKRKTGTLSDQ